MDEYAGVLDRRAEALLVDAFLIVAAIAILGYGAGMVFSNVPYGGGFATIAAIQFLAPVVLLGYQIGFEGYYGQTPGKRSRGIVVVNDDGSSITWGGAIIRNLLRFVDSLPVFYIIGIVVAYLTNDHQRIGDVAGGTVVVHTID